MTLTYEVDSLDTVPENRRDLYVANESGGYVLAIDGAAGLTGALKAERAARRTLEKELRPLGETPEQRAEKLATVAAVGTTIEQIQKHAAQEKAALVAELEAARKHEREAIADTVLATALKAAKVTDTAADLIAQKLLPRVNIETKDGKRAVAIMSADGTTPMVNADGKPAGFADLMREAQTAWPDCFEGTGAGGGGTNPKQKGPAASKVLTRAEFDRLSPKEKSDKMLGGWKLTDN